MEKAIDAMDEQYEYYFAHKAEFVNKYLGKDLLICNKALQGVFDDAGEALRYAHKNNFANGDFIVKTVTKKEPVYAMIPTLVQIEGDRRDAAPGMGASDGLEG